MNELSSIAGLVLAGGRSSRFGADKALARVGERTMLELGLDRFAPCRVRAVAVRREGAVADAARSLGAWVINDVEATASGPLAGIAAGLSWASANGCAHLAIAPCDAPRVSWRHYQHLAEEMGASPAAFAVTSAGEHPLCAIWRATLYAPLMEAMAGGKHPSVRAFLHQQAARAVRFEDGGAFVNVNTAGELALVVQESVS